jgi:signal transduction histidine kinase
VRRISWQLLAAAVLLVLLAALATLQYRWLGEVSEAERERMRATLRTRATEFAQEFDGELTRTYATFHVDGDRLNADPSATLADAYTRWQSSTTVPGLVQDVYLLQPGSPDDIQHFDVALQALEPSEWPPELTALRTASSPIPAIAGMPAPIFIADAIDARTPALVIGIPRLRRVEGRGALAVVPDPGGPGGVVLVVLDRDRLHRQFLEPLVAKYFGSDADSEYRVTIVRRDDGQVVFPAEGTASSSEQTTADVTTGLFDLRMDELNRSMSLTHGPGAIARDRMAITIVRRANGPDGNRVLMAGGAGQGAWEVRVRHRAGSLESIVAQSRRRNLVISLGVLGLLAASFMLVIASAQRQKRLARQQMEFVAAVSHELRTPLAVIRSAGENLADGVVADSAQVKRYGALVETEGRRLTAMVDRVMEFAGITSGAPAAAQVEVDVSSVMYDAVHGLDADARDRGVTIHVHPGGTLPAVLGDREALRSALQNIVGNAVKYSPSGGTVEIAAEARDRFVRIRVSDRGLGIDADDLPHIFKAFYRGRRALDAQVRGSGVGLSVVRHVIDAHRGKIDVDSRPGEGTTVTVDLPAAAATPTPVRPQSGPSPTPVRPRSDPGPTPTPTPRGTS